MAIRSIRMPSFEFTKAEKAKNDNQIYFLLGRCSSLLKSYQTSSSVDELREASLAINRALYLASEPDTCESPPLAKCYIYKGHVLWSMKKHIEARNAYKTAASVPTRNSIDRTVSEQAAGWAVLVDQKIREWKRQGGIWEDAYHEHFAKENEEQSQYESDDECHNKRPRKVVRRFKCPPIQNVRVTKVSYIKTPQLHPIAQQQRLVQCNDGWTGETAY